MVFKYWKRKEKKNGEGFLQLAIVTSITHTFLYVGSTLTKQNFSFLMQ